jgi:hypothetical protein
MAQERVKSIRNCSHRDEVVPAPNSHRIPAFGAPDDPVGGWLLSEYPGTRSCRLHSDPLEPPTTPSGGNVYPRGLRAARHTASTPFIAHSAARLNP